MNIAQMRATKPNVAVVSTLNYIEDLAIQMDVPIWSWDLNELFKAKDKDSITHSRAEINKIFFSYAKEHEKKELKIDLTPDTLKKIEIAQSRLRGTRRSSIEETIGFTQQEISNLESKIRQKTLALKELFEAFDGIEFNFSGQLSKILSGGFFLFEGVLGSDSSPIIHLTTAPFMLIYKRSDREIRLPMGRILIRWSMTDNNLTVKEFRNNINCHGYIHPYVSNHGSICWGTGFGAVTRYQAQSNMPEVFKILQTILTTFVDSTPYHAIECFEENGKIEGLPWKEFQERDLKYE
jgi:hypothetical protein